MLSRVTRSCHRKFGFFFRVTVALHIIHHIWTQSKTFLSSTPQGLKAKVKCIDVEREEGFRKKTNAL